MKKKKWTTGFDRASLLNSFGFRRKLNHSTVQRFDYYSLPFPTPSWTPCDVSHTLNMKYSKQITTQYYQYQVSFKRRTDYKFGKNLLFAFLVNGSIINDSNTLLFVSGCGCKHQKVVFYGLRIEMFKRYM